MLRDPDWEELPGYTLAQLGFVGPESEHAQDATGQGDTTDKVRRFALTNADGLRVELLALGAAVQTVRLTASDAPGVTLTRGLSEPAQHAVATTYMGAICGRYAGRIADANFSLDGADFELTANDGNHHLHGGGRGFSARVWAARPFGPDSTGATAMQGMDQSRAVGVHFD